LIAVHYIKKLCHCSGSFIGHGFSWGQKLNEKKEIKDSRTDVQKSNKTSIMYSTKTDSKLFSCSLDSLGKRILYDKSKKKKKQRKESKQQWRKRTLFEQKMVDKSTENMLPVKNGPLTKLNQRKSNPRDDKN
jgi:hypothetical protein